MITTQHRRFSPGRTKTLGKVYLGSVLPGSRWVRGSFTEEIILTLSPEGRVGICQVNNRRKDRENKNLLAQRRGRAHRLGKLLVLFV